MQNMSLKLKKRIISAILTTCIIVSSTMTVFAGPDDSGGGNPTDPGGGTVNADGSNRGDAPSSSSSGSGKNWGKGMDDKGQGLRVYCTDDSGNLIISDYGVAIYDCMYPDKKTPAGRQLVYASGSANTGYARAAGNRKYSIDKRSTDILKDSGRSETVPYFIKSTSSRLTVSGGTLKNYLLSNISGQTKGEIIWLHYLLGTYWQSTYDQYRTNPNQPGEIHLFIEPIFEVPITQGGKDVGKYFHGTLYELAKYCESRGCSKFTQIFGDNKSNIGKYIKSGAVLITDEAGISAPPKGHQGDTILEVSTFLNTGYGIYGFHIGGDGEQLMDITPPPESDTTVAEDVQVSLDYNPEYYTSYYASDGMYDIGKNAGIPTTERLDNFVKMQDWFAGIKYNTYQANREYTLNFKLKYNYSWSKKVYIGTKNGKKQYKTESGSGSDVYENSVTVPRAALYYYISDYYVYGSSELTTDNECDSLTYGFNGIDDSEIEINISGIDKPGSIEQMQSGFKTTDETKHIDWTACEAQNNTTFSNGTCGAGSFSASGSSESSAKSSARNKAKSWFDSHAQKFAEGWLAYPTVNSDLCRIAGFTYLDNTPQTGTSNNISIALAPSPDTFDMHKTFTEQNTKNTQIPYYILNGMHYTELTAYYDLKCGIAENWAPMVSFSWTGSDNDKSHIFEGQSLTLKNGSHDSAESNEPIHIITPIIAPATLDAPYSYPDLTDEQKAGMTPEQISEYEQKQLLLGTQLTTGNETGGVQQMRLDETYTITFDPRRHNAYLGYGYSGFIDNDNPWSGRDGYDTDNKYDKYVLEKYVRFPFDVYIDDILFNAGSWICLYEYDPLEDVTYSGDVKGNHLITTKFYIPSWAQELTGNIDLAVYSLNYPGLDVENSRDNDLDYNPNDDAYLARYKITVQTSGWVYDFKILGTSPGTNWGDSLEDFQSDSETEQKYHTFVTDLSPVGDEFFNGIYNRTGADGDDADKLQRHEMSGIVEEADAKDVIPLSSGSSEWAAMGGTLPRCSEIAFSIKTMANLDRDDKIIIKPKFRWYSDDFSDSRTAEELLMYYTNGGDTLVKYDSDRDKENIYHTWLGYWEFGKTPVGPMENSKESGVHQEDISYMMNKTGKKYWEIVSDKYPVGDMGTLVLGGDLMLYDESALDQLKINQKNNNDNLVDILSTAHGYAAKLGASLQDKKNPLTESIQTWYGKYIIPKNIHVVDKKKLEQMGYVDLEDYAVKTGHITYDEDFWLDRGILVLTFDITVIKDGNAWLSYEKGNSDQWQRQGQREKAGVWTNESVMMAGVFYNTDIMPFNTELYAAGLFFTNN